MSYILKNLWRDEEPLDIAKINREIWKAKVSKSAEVIDALSHQMLEADMAGGKCVFVASIYPMNGLHPECFDRVGYFIYHYWGGEYFDVDFLGRNYHVAKYRFYNRILDPDYLRKYHQLYLDKLARGRQRHEERAAEKRKDRAEAYQAYKQGMFFAKE